MSIELSPTLIERYNVAVPRYTSYPPANLFSRSYTAQEYKEDVLRSNDYGAQDLSFYIHIPYCRRICSYCACNKELILSQSDGVDTYVRYLLRELDLLAQYISPERGVSQIHFGGGSPSAIPLHYIREIIDAILSRFHLKEGAEVAIECHPGYLGEKEWGELLAMPFTRFSLGVQDFDTEVLKAVKRTPSRLPVPEVVAMLQRADRGVNLDFIYGLPGQTPQTFAHTITQALECKPERLVTFSYAHVPWIHEHQRALEPLGLPDAATKKSMYDHAATLALEAGYMAVGLDHFVQPNDALGKALVAHRLHRNFQGYCTKELTAQVYGLGVSAIAQLEGSYAQNTKSIPDYYAAIDRGELPTHIGYRLSDDERMARDIINDLMCNYRTTPSLIATKYERSNPVVHAQLLEQMIIDGLVRTEGDTLIMSDNAHLFVRNVAATFDLHYTPGASAGYSKPI